MRPPSISGIAISSLQFLAFMLPPYWMRTFSAQTGQNTSASVLRMKPMVSFACSAVAVLPVPIAHTGS